MTSGKVIYERNDTSDNVHRKWAPLKQLKLKFGGWSFWSSKPVSDTPKAQKTKL